MRFEELTEYINACECNLGIASTKTKVPKPSKQLEAPFASVCLF
jgi:hypothetical protein